MSETSSKEDTIRQQSNRIYSKQYKISANECTSNVKTPVRTYKTTRRYERMLDNCNELQKASKETQNDLKVNQTAEKGTQTGGK